MRVWLTDAERCMTSLAVWQAIQPTVAREDLWQDMLTSIASRHARPQPSTTLRRSVSTALQVEFGPAGYNIGINDGAAAGQTVPHVHLHLIPRYEGDRGDPRGGVRWVLPNKAAYWDSG